MLKQTARIGLALGATLFTLALAWGVVQGPTSGDPLASQLSPIPTPTADGPLWVGLKLALAPTPTPHNSIQNEGSQAERVWLPLVVDGSRTLDRQAFLPVVFGQNAFYKSLQGALPPFQVIPIENTPNASPGASW